MGFSTNPDKTPSSSVFPGHPWHDPFQYELKYVVGKKTLKRVTVPQFYRYNLVVPNFASYKKIGPNQKLKKIMLIKRVPLEPRSHWIYTKDGTNSLCVF
jgi:hypothetical protein